MENTNTPKSRGGGVLLLAGLLIAVVSLILLVVKGWKPGVTEPVPVPEPAIADATLKAAYEARRPDFDSWIGAWRVVTPEVRLSEFRLDGTQPLTVQQYEGGPMRLEISELSPPMANRYVWSTDQRRFVDYLGAYGEPDSLLTVYNRDGKETLERLGYCGTACSFDGAVWLDAGRVVVLGSEEASTPEGLPLCGVPAEPLPQSSLGCRVLTLALYDLGANTVSRYVSLPRVLNVNPLDEAKKSRWESGRGPVTPPVVNITLAVPRQGSAVGATFTLRGTARTFESTVRIRIVNLSTSRVLLDHYTTADAPDVGKFGDYRHDVVLDPRHVEPGHDLAIEVFQNSANDGREIDKVSHVVKYRP